MSDNEEFGYHKNNYKHLDGMVTLNDSQNKNDSQNYDKMSDSSFHVLTRNYAPMDSISIDKLFSEEDNLFFEPECENMNALDSQTLPILFREQSAVKPIIIIRALQGVKPMKKCELEIYIANKISDLANNDSQICKFLSKLCRSAGFDSEFVIELGENSQLKYFDKSCRITIKELLCKIMKFALENIVLSIRKEDIIKPKPPQISETESIIAESKKQRKQWSRLEEEILQKTLESYGNSIKNVTEEIWLELSQKFSRTICSIHAKAKTLCKTKDNTSKIMTDIKENFGTIHQQICDALVELPSKKGTKEQIIQKISEKYNKPQTELKKGVEQCLSRKFEKFPGTYKLKPDVRFIDKITKLSTVKDKLVYLLQQKFAYESATLNQIKEAYFIEFNPQENEMNEKILLEGNQQTWEKTIAKTLLKNDEFDKTNSKTQYGIKR